MAFTDLLTEATQALFHNTSNETTEQNLEMLVAHANEHNKPINVCFVIITWSFQRGLFNTGKLHKREALSKGGCSSKEGVVTGACRVSPSRPKSRKRQQQESENFLYPTLFLLRYLQTAYRITKERWQAKKSESDAKPRDSQHCRACAVGAKLARLVWDRCVVYLCFSSTAVHKQVWNGKTNRQSPLKEVGDTRDIWRFSRRHGDVDDAGRQTKGIVKPAVHYTADGT
ncbi:hypothetical protein BaRGS_00002055 [Batillaria attramentaria]|uniref:Uncharacterized protein n=1 Tax=Batillaria attramentaria TaxID=370345 RepID=A0ABD0M514_9CAEN